VQEWCDHETPEKEKLPQEWKSKSTFERLLIIRALRPDRMMYAVQLWIAEDMGPQYVDPKPIPIDASFEETSPQAPMFFVLSPGVDPVKVCNTPFLVAFLVMNLPLTGATYALPARSQMHDIPAPNPRLLCVGSIVPTAQDVEALGRKLGYTSDNGKFRFVSLGQGQEPVAEEGLDHAYKVGHAGRDTQGRPRNRACQTFFVGPHIMGGRQVPARTHPKLTLIAAATECRGGFGIARESFFSASRWEGADHQGRIEHRSPWMHTPTENDLATCLTQRPTPPLPPARHVDHAREHPPDEQVAFGPREEA